MDLGVGGDPSNNGEMCEKRFDFGFTHCVRMTNPAVANEALGPVDIALFGAVAEVLGARPVERVRGASGLPSRMGIV